MTIRVIWAKIVALTALFLLVVLFGIFPIKLIGLIRKLRGGDAKLHDYIILRLLSCFAGGLFLGTFLIHLLPEVREQFEDICLEANIQSEFPMAEFLTAFGFFLVMVLENVVESCRRGGHSNSKLNPTEVTEKISISQSDSLGNFATTSGETEPLLLKTGKKDDGNMTVSPLRSLLLLIALSLHTLFEGLALGLQKDESKIWSLLLAICVHKGVIAFALSLELYRNFSGKHLLWSIFAFSVMSPVGIAIGICVTETSQTNFSQNIASLVLQGIASGTFLYVTFFEILQKEMIEKLHDLKHVLAVILGFSVITGLWFQNQGH